MATRLSRIISQFYEDPENERRYQAWLEANAETRGKREARPRYQRQPRPIRNRTNRSIPHRSHELLGASLALALCITIIWGFSWAYQVGYEKGYGYAVMTAVTI